MCQCRARASGVKYAPVQENTTCNGSTGEKKKKNNPKADGFNAKQRLTGNLRCVSVFVIEG